MKGKWKLCMVSGSIMVFAVLGALILVQAVMSSADRKERVFELAEGAARQSVSGSAASGGASSKEAVSSGEAADHKKSESTDGKKEHPVSPKDEEGEEEDEILDTANVIGGFSKDEDSLGERIAAYAESMQGVPYVYGRAKLPEEPVTYTYSFDETGRKVMQNNLKNLYGSEFGADCSGLVQAVFKKFEIRLPRSVKDQAKQGREIKLKDVRPGDLIFYGTSNARLTHCGIYVGEDKIIHASARTKYVEVSDMNYRRIAKVVRVVEE